MENWLRFSLESSAIQWQKKMLIAPCQKTSLQVKHSDKALTGRFHNSSGNGNQ